ncbi:MAG: hypothetical protein JKY53_14800, partial [Flavobacteriales bacterium]|nr:hypothetical protein [Flavobacteriales bacterium]
RKIYVKNDTLRYFRSTNSENSLVPISPNEFKMLGISVILIAKFDVDENGNKTMSVRVDEGAPPIFESYNPIADSKEFKDYIGRFYSPELESTFDIVIKDEKLVFHHGRHNDFPMQLIKGDVLEIPGYAIIKFEREKNNRITGFRVSNSRAKNVWFVKQK